MTQARVCIVTSDLVGPARNSGVEAWNSDLARTLAGAGHRITLLYVLNDYCERGTIADRIARYAGLGIELVPLEPAPTPALDAPRLAKLSYATFEWLRARQGKFDVIHFHEWKGHGFYSLQAKRQGLAFAGNVLVVGAHGPTLWLRTGNFEYVGKREDLEADFMERESVALADVLVSPDPSVLDWMRGRGWRLPHRIEVTPDFLLDNARGGTASAAQDRPRISTAPTAVAEHRPLVSICVIHRNRPAFLEQALRSVEEQTYDNFEVILVDDGSTDSEALAALDRLEQRFLARGWRVLRQPNRFMGAARNEAARHARGEYLLFMDDDNIAKPQELAAFVSAASASGADILTSFMDVFSGDSYGPEGGVPDCRWLPLGAAVASGLFDNRFGDANCFIRRSVFFELGCFTEDYGVVHEDVELFAKAVLGGYRLEVVPEALFWYRIHPGSFLRNSLDYRNRMRGIRPYLDAVPESLRDTLAYALGLYMAQPANSNGAAEPGHPDYQAMVDLYWNSMSWKLTSPARRVVRLLKGQSAEAPPVVHNREQAMTVIDNITRSISWELTGPLRVAGRLARKLWRLGTR